MSVEEVEPSRVVDRDSEQQILDEMLEFTDDARLLVVSAEAGDGKSEVMRRLHWNCGSKSIPVSLVDLENATDQFKLAVALRAGLKRVAFSRFNSLNDARMDKNWRGIRRLVEHYGGNSEVESLAAAPTGISLVDARQAQIDGGVLAGRVEKLEQTTVTGNFTKIDYHASEWTTDKETQAQEWCVESFLRDLLSLDCAVVLLLDSYDKASQAVRQWVEQDLVRSLCLDGNNRPSRLIVALAGRPQQLPDFSAAEQYGLARICNLKPFHDPSLVRQLFEVKAVANADDPAIQLAYDYLRSGKWTVRTAILRIQYVLG